MRPWKTLERRVLLSRKPWLEVGEEKVELPDGRVVDGYPWIISRDFALVVALTADDRVVAIRSYKHGARRIQLELPAGYIEQGEQPLETAKRELSEETGYAADDWSSLGAFVIHGNYGIGTEHIYLARGARRVSEPDHGDLEELEVTLRSMRELLAAVERGEMMMLSSVAALGLAALRLR
jgi:ADP-ribose diphosphatase